MSPPRPPRGQPRRANTAPQRGVGGPSKDEPKPSIASRREPRDGPRPPAGRRGHRPPASPYPPAGTGLSVPRHLHGGRRAASPAPPLLRRRQPQQPPQPPPRSFPALSFPHSRAGQLAPLRSPHRLPGDGSAGPFRRAPPPRPADRPRDAQAVLRPEAVGRGGGSQAGNFPSPPPPPPPPSSFSSSPQRRGGGGSGAAWRTPPAAATAGTGRPGPEGRERARAAEGNHHHHHDHHHHDHHHHDHRLPVLGPSSAAQRRLFLIRTLPPAEEGLIRG